MKPRTIVRTAVFILIFPYALSAANLTLPVTSPKGHFEFRSDPWINLHHFLYHWSRAHQAREQILWGRVRLDPVDTEVDLGESEESWDMAAAAYLQLMDRDLLDGEGMREMKVAIAQGPEHWPDQTPFNELRLAMSIYMENWWAHHDRKNRDLVAALLPLLEAHEAGIAADLASQYESEWPDEPVEVHVSYYTNWAGAYTSYGPNLIMMASSREEMHGPYGLEILFHEAGHTVPLGEKVRPLSLHLADRQGVEEGDVWHATLFFITGNAVRQALGPSHLPYAEKFGLWQRDRWNGLHGPIESAFAAQTKLTDRLNRIHQERAASAK